MSGFGDRRNRGAETERLESICSSRSPEKVTCRHWPGSNPRFARISPLNAASPTIIQRRETSLSSRVAAVGGLALDIPDDGVVAADGRALA
jgi:hypothetical protein